MDNNMPLNDITMEFVPMLIDDEVDLKRYSKVPLLDLAALGIGFESISTAIQNFGVEATGGSGIYKVVVPPGGEMMRFKNGKGFLGSVKGPNGGVGGGQAVLNPVQFDPTMVFMAVAMMNIQHKLNEIQETQEEILQFLEQKEKAELRGNILFMSDVINNYKYNWNNPQYLSNHHVKILDIKQKAEQSILFAQNRIKTVAAKEKIIKFSPDVNAKVKKLKKGFEDYQLAVYTYAMASYVETMLLKNFDKAYMDSVANKVEKYSVTYRELYTECYDVLSDFYDKSVDVVMIEGMAKAAKAAGETIAKLPVVGKAELDENLIAVGEIMDDSDGTIKMGKLSDMVSKQSSYVQPFVENIRAVGEVYSKPLTLMFDEENLYYEPIPA